MPSMPPFWGAVLLVAWAMFLWSTQETLHRLTEELPSPLSLPTTGSIVTSRRNASSLLQGTKQYGEEEEDFYYWDATKQNRLKFLVFQGNIPGQGAGNLMNGLLATHWLAEEFDRIVCVSPAFEDFWLAFEPIEERTLQYCSLVMERWQDHLNKTHPLKPGRRHGFHRPPFNGKYSLEMINFNAAAVNECALQDKLASDVPVWYLQANMYPRWPTTTTTTSSATSATTDDESLLLRQETYFETLYRPRAILREVLPSPLPRTVVHLRKEDGPRDHRRGLDEPSLRALGEHLQQSSMMSVAATPYLVTNHVEYYRYFEDHFHWTHPQYDQVIHSALVDGMGVGVAASTLSPQSSTTTKSDHHHDHQLPNKTQVAMAIPPLLKDPKKARTQQKLWMWSDWYVCHKATTVYHTFSDFSASAVHWNEHPASITTSQSQSSRIIRGFNATTQQLDLAVEWWRQPQASRMGILPRLVDRMSSELLNCS